jgi:acetyl esterase
MAESGYDHIIDAETRAFIKRTEAYYSGDTSTMTIAGQRAAYDAMCRDFHQGRPAWVTVKDRPLAALPARHYCCEQADDADSVCRTHSLYPWRRVCCRKSGQP